MKISSHATIIGLLPDLPGMSTDQRFALWDAMQKAYDLGLTDGTAGAKAAIDSLVGQVAHFTADL